MVERVLRVLVVDDNPGDARLVEWSLAHEPDGAYRCERAGRIEEALAVLEQGPIDAVLLDLGLPDSSGTAGLLRVRERAPEAAVVVLTGSDDPLRARDAIAAGAQDYQVKGVFPRGHLTQVLSGAVHRQQLETAVRRGEPLAPDRLALGDDAYALVEHGRPPVLNDAWVRLTGLPRERAAEHLAWLQRLAAGASVGDTVLDRPGADPVAVEYVVRTYGEPPDARRLVRLRDRFRPPAVPAPLATTPPVASGPIDEAIWSQLGELAGSDTAFLASVVDTFLEEARASLARLESGAAADDADGVERAAHRLKSGCAQVGALTLAHRLAELERKAHELSPVALRQAVGEVAREFPRLVAELGRRRGPG